MHPVQDDARLALNALRRIVRALRLSATHVERGVGLTMAQLYVLQQLDANGPRSIIELAEGTLTDPSSVSVLVGRLVDARLVERRPSPGDGRRAEISLTALGRRRLARAPQAAQTRLVAALRQLGATRRHALALALDHVAQVMGAMDPAMFFEDERNKRGVRRARA